MTMVLVILSIYIVCELPLFVFEIYVHFGKAFHGEVIVSNVLELIAITNFFLNAVVYGVMHPGIWSSIKHLATCRLQQSGTNQSIPVKETQMQTISRPTQQITLSTFVAR